ncbi:MAG: valine--tRNA ligase [bacterium]|nr:valine--tRNA ligase [bacterium]
MSPASETLPKAYDPTEVEARWYPRWTDAGIFRAEAADTLEGGREPYVIMMPPPNVTGTLHNGHALFVTLQDILIRYHRMKGKNTLWLPGVDHAGIATQAVVERELKRHEGQSRHDLGREAFVERVWEWKERNGSRIVEQLKVMGAAADWTRERFTLDPTCSRAVNEAFVRLWDEGLIFRGERLINWDPATRTALSNEEVEHEEREGELWRFAYPLTGSDEEIVVATTRPETMLGDTAVAVHPEDERYAAMVGKKLRHPFFPERELAVIADSEVDPTFGTGAVKITPAHDPNDFEMGKRHDLGFLNIFDLEARVNENGGPFQGQDRYVARENVKTELERLGLARGGEAMTHAVSISERSGEAVEPMLSRQYFVRAAPLAAEACAALDELGQTELIPASWKSTWDHFMKNIHDWCISRQLWWGHRIPVFYDTKKLEEAIHSDASRKGGDTAALRALEGGAQRGDLVRLALDTVDEDLVRSFSVASRENLCEGASGERYVQEEDVLDTWFSAGLWPMSTLGWPEETDDLRAFYPGAVLETGFDILFFWVARMMMFGCHFMGRAPFGHIFLHAMVRDAHGHKMSKSLGNAIDPLDVIHGISKDALIEKTKTYPVPEKNLSRVLKALAKEYPDGIPASGADGLRFSLAALSGQGRDVKLSIPRVAGYRAFLNKVWNATRFALMGMGEEEPPPLDACLDRFSMADRWILSRLQAATERVAAGIETYRFDEAANGVYQFFWNEFCDWYIELSKDALMPDASQETRQTTRSVLIHVLDASMRMLHPICPFQSEEIWQRLPGRDTRWGSEVPFCAVAPFPEVDASLVDLEAETQIDRVVRAVSRLRNLRQESGLPQRQRIPAVILAEDDAVRESLGSVADEVKRLARLSELQIDKPSAYSVPTQAAVHAEPDLQVVLPLEGLIDLDAERGRVEKDLARARKELEGYERKLGNPGYVNKAPAEVVEETRARAGRCQEKIEGLLGSLERLGAS